MPATENRAALERAIAAWNADDHDGYLSFYDPDIVLHSLPPGTPPGIAGVRRYYVGAWRGYPGSQLALDDVIAEEDRVACRYRWSARSRSGGAFVVPGITIMHFRDGRCFERWDFEGPTEPALSTTAG